MGIRWKELCPRPFVSPGIFHVYVLVRRGHRPPYCRTHKSYLSRESILNNVVLPTASIRIKTKTYTVMKNLSERGFQDYKWHNSKASGKLSYNLCTVLLKYLHFVGGIKTFFIISNSFQKQIMHKILTICLLIHVSTVQINIVQNIWI